jgi:hypothetical protein
MSITGTSAKDKNHTKHCTLQVSKLKMSLGESGEKKVMFKSLLDSRILYFLNISGFGSATLAHTKRFSNVTPGQKLQLVLVSPHSWLVLL